MKYFNTKRQKLRLCLFPIFLVLFFGNTVQMKLGIAAVKSEELKESNSPSWTNIGPYGGHINCMAISLSNPDIIFAGTPTGLFKTVDGCANWTETGFSEKEVNKVQVDPYNPDVIYLGTNDASDGIFKSEDGGETWAEMGLTDHSITALAIDPNSSNVLYTGTRYRYQVGQYEWEAEVTIFKSTDGGETWEKKISWITDGECGWDYVEYILVDPDDSYCIYAGGENNDNCPEFGGFLKSTDGGGTWINRSLTFETEELVTALAKPANSQVIYALCEENDDYNLYKTTDKGDNWIKVECPYSLAEGVLAVDLIYPERVYAGSNDGEMPLLVYKDDEDKWYSGGEGLPPQTPSSVVIDPQDSDTLYLGFSDGGVYKSTDWAVNWNEENQGLNNVTINALAVHPTSSEKVFAAGSGFGYSMAKTANHGTSWDYLINAPSNIENISLSHQDPPIILVGKGYQGITGIPSTVYFSIYKSTDDGQNWTKINFAYCSGDYCALRLADILIDENNSDYILLGTTSVWQGAQPFIARTTDGGINWDGWVDTFYITGASALAVDPNNPGVVYSADKYYGGLDGCVYRHTDVWGAWSAERIKTGIEGFVRDIEVDMSSNLYVATWKGLLKWDGSVWKKLTGLPTDSINALEIDRTASPETLYVAPGGNGVYVSQDGGSTWIPFNEGLANLNITKLALSETQPGILYAGTKYGGVWSINVSPFNKYKLTIAAGSGGTTDPAPGTYTHDEGAEVTITASPESGYEFSGWSGDASGTTNPITIIMDSDKTITANFILIPQHTLTIAAGEGGTTDPVPGSYAYDIGTEVNIEAIPNNGYEFSHWSGDVAVGHENDNPITISMDADKSVTANFNVISVNHELVINSALGGTTDPVPGLYSYLSGTEICIEAVPDPGTSFMYWGGDVPEGHENDNPLCIIMDLNKTITPYFSYEPMWTFMVYLDGDNNLEDDGIDDFLEMASVGSNEYVNIVVQFDRHGGYTSSYDNWTTTKRFYITSGMTPTSANALQDLGELNHGNPQTLIDFIDWAKANYPAQKYALILWNHGGGWRESKELQAELEGKKRSPYRAVCWDYTDGNDTLYMDEVQGALDATGNNHLIGFDACLMGMMEVAYEIKGYAEVMVGSEESEPEDGWPYDLILQDLVNNPSWSSSQLGQAIVDRYFESYGDDYTQSAIDLSQMDTLASAISSFAQSLMENWNTDEAAVKSAASEVMTEIESAVIYEQHGSGWPGANGLAVYFPLTSGEFDPDYESVIDFTNNTQWDEFLQKFHNFMRESWIADRRGASQSFTWPLHQHTDLYHFCERLQEEREIFYTKSNISHEYLGGGAAWNFQGDEASRTYTLPFDFPFFGETIPAGATIYVCINGYIDFNDFNIDYSNSGAELVNNKRIAPYWVDLRTNGSAQSGEDVYITANADSLVIRWRAQTYSGAVPVNVELILYDDGRIQFNYDAGNDLSATPYNPTIGISKGDGINSYFAVHNGQKVLTDVDSVVFTPMNMEPPSLPGNPSPAHEAAEVSLETDLRWDDCIGATSYDVYFGTSSPAPFVRTVSSSYCDPGTLNEGTTYYWKVVAKNDYGETEGSEWSFATCALPGTFNYFMPSDGATDVSIDTDLDWEDSAGAASYDIYIGDSSPPPYVETTAESYYDPGPLNYSTTYYWKIVARNNCGSAEGSEWNFITASMPQGPEINIKVGATNIPDGGSYDFGSHEVGIDSDATFTIENTGNADLELSGLPIVITGVDADQFSVEKQPISPVTAGGGSTTFIIRFSPSSAGFKEASISIANNDGNENPYDITLEGTGVVSTGSLTINIEPQGAIDGGAQWKRLCATTWYDSGDTESDIPAGDVIVEFNEVAGWHRPANQIVSIIAGDKVGVTGTYVPLSGSGTFVDSGQSLGSESSYGAKLGDLDGDGDLDVFVANYSSPANKVWLNDGNGTFSDSGQSLGSGYSFCVALGDIDNDGDLDAFVANDGPNRVWLNDGSGTFSDSGQSLGSGYSKGVRLGDVDCDGDLDAFIANHDEPNTIWLNDGSGTFTDSGQSLGNRKSMDLAFGDFDGDGDLDVFVANAGYQSNRVWLNDGSGTFTDSGQSLASAWSLDVEIGDFDGDGYLDAFVSNSANQSNRVWLNDGSGIFTDSGQSLGSSTSLDVEIGDFDGDGDLDAFIANASNQANKVWLNDGSGTFTDSGQSLGSSYSFGAALGRINGDNSLDVIVANYSSQANKVWLNECTSPSITTQPQSQTIQYNTSASLSVTATGTAPLSYQWYQGDSGDTATPVGTDSDSYTTPNLIATTSYWVRVSNACGSVDSNTAAITVNLPPDLIVDSLTHSPLNPIIGEEITITAVVKNVGTGPAGSSHLELRAGGESSPPTYSVPALGSGDTHTVERQHTFNVAQPYLITATADINEEVAESDETNNITTDSITVSPPPVPEINIKYDTTDIPDGGSYDFGDCEVGAYLDATFTIENNGTAGLALDGSPIIVIGGADAEQFSVEQQPTSPIDPGGSTTFIIRFSPSSAGFKNASISIANNDADEDPYDIKLEGTGLATGSLLVNIEPQGARDAGAQWRRLCNVTWYDSGYTESDIATGDVIVEFKDIDGWIKPANQTATITAGGTASATGTYIHLGGYGIFIDSGQSIGSSYGRYVVLGDLDGDGYLDAFGPDGGTKKVWLNDGLGTFTDSGQSLSSVASNGAALGDVDCDGDLDAFVANSGPNRVWLNDGLGNFSDSGQGLGNSSSNDVELGDLDRDGDLDAFVANEGGANKVWLNDGTGTFTDSGQNLGGSIQSFGVALGDVDGDGDLDAFIVNYYSVPNKVWLNDGSGTFTDSGQNLGDANSKGVALGDLDGDGDLDAFIVNLSVGNWVWLNDGTGTFTDSGQSLNNPRSFDVELGDLDGDGDLDAFVANGQTIGLPNRVWLNDGIGTFIDSGQRLGNADSMGLALGDLDGDGDLDGFVVNYEADKVWLNECTSPSITTQPQSQTIVYNTSASLSVTAAGTAPLSCQWYQGSSGDTSTPVGTDSDSYTTPNLTATTSYWVRVSNACGSADSVTATICVLSGTPANLAPLNGASDILVDAGLDWEDSSGATSYAVYFGGSSPPPYVETTTESSYDPGTLNYSTAYYWKIVAKNDCGSTEGSEWNFTTISPPPVPEINIKYDTTDIPDGGSYNFGSHAVGTDMDVTLTIENTGTAELTLSGSPIITIAGTYADQFSVEQEPALSIASGSSTTFIIRFSPTSEGSKTASISIANNDADEDPYDITLTGTGLKSLIIATGSYYFLTSANPDYFANTRVIALKGNAIVEIDYNGNVSQVTTIPTQYECSALENYLDKFLFASADASVERGIYTILQNGTVQVLNTSNFDNPYSIRIAPYNFGSFEGDIFVIEAGNTDEIGADSGAVDGVIRITPGGDKSQFYDGINASLKLYQTQDLAFSPSEFGDYANMLFVIDNNKDFPSIDNHRILAIYPDQTAEVFFDLDNLEDSSNIVALDFNPVNNELFVASRTKIYKISSDGSYEVFDQGYNSINDIRFDRYGNLYICDLGVSSLLLADIGLEDLPPTVSITSPSDGSTLADTVQIEAEANDDIGVTKVEFYIDGTKVGEDTTESYEYSWDTTAYSNGPHTVKVKVFDTSAQTVEDEITITLNNLGPTYVSGPISTDITWTKANSPYIITGNVLVSSDVALTIEAGVEVKFQSGVSLQIDGILIARGVEGDRIFFTSDESSPEPGDWGYILFSDSSVDAVYDGSGNYLSGSIMEYCVVEYTGGASVSNNGGLRINSSSPCLKDCVISNNSESGIRVWDNSGDLKIENIEIHDNSSTGHGGGIYLTNGSATVSNGQITNNIATNSGGGIYASDSTLTVKDSTISDNSASNGGGIYSYNGTINILNNHVEDNVASSAGGGICVGGGTIDISDNIITGNTAENSSGGGMCICGTTGSFWIHVPPTGSVLENFIYNNSAGYQGGGVWIENLEVSKNIISGNSSGGEGGGVYESYGGSTLTYNAIHGNGAADMAALNFISSENCQYNTLVDNVSASSKSISIINFPNFNNNNIFNNTATYELYNDNAEGAGSVNAESNWWGTDVDAEIQAKIYDWFDDGTKSIVNYSPFLTSPNTAAPISPPADLTAIPGVTTITLNWSTNPESDVAGYRVYWDRDCGFPYANVVDVGNVTSYTILGITSGETYYVAVTAYDSDYAFGNDDPDTIVNENQTNGHESWYTKTESMLLPEIPTNPSPADGETGVALDTDLDWDDNIGATSYDVYFGASSPPPYVETTTESYYDPGTLDYSAIYFWKISAKNAYGSTLGAEWSFTTIAPPPVPEINIKYDTTDISDGGSYDFGLHPVGTGTDVTFTIENTGTADLTLSGLPIIITGADEDQFNVQQQPTSPISDGGGSTTFIIRFSPSSAGFKEASISIANNDTDENPYDITLEGTGVVLTGSLTVTVEPQGAIDAGAQWKRLCTTTWYDSGYTESDIPAGNVIVEFKEVAGWLKPDNEIIFIPGDETEVFSGTYTQLFGWGIFVDSGQSLGNSESEDVALGDVDGDGDLDAFVANEGGANNVWLNDGSGTFTDSGQSLGSSSSCGIALGDVDGDNDLDAFVANIAANKVWLNDGSGIFTDSSQSLGDSSSYGAGLGDLDCDGDLDAFVANYGAHKVWLNDGSGIFTDSGQSLGDSSSRSGVALGDVDGDGDLDAFICNRGPADKVWLNDGSGTFTDSGQSLGSSESIDVAFGDVDKDGDLDVYVVSFSSQDDKVWLNDGDGTFTDSGQMLGSSGNFDVELGDVDGDGDLDAFVVKWFSRTNSVWLNDGSGIFTDSGQRLGDSWSAGLEIGDVDGDGDLDAFVVNGHDTPGNKVWLNTCIPPEITEHSQSQTINYNTAATLSVIALSVQTLSYQWYQGDSGDTSTPVGEDSDSYTTPNLTQTTSYWVRVSNACGSADSVTATICVLSGTPANLAPLNGASDILVDADLDWEDSSGATSYAVYFGGSSPPPYVETTTGSYYDPGTLDYGTTYYWKVVAKNDCGSTEGSEWNFTTTSPPSVPEINIKYDTTNIADGGSYDFGSHSVGTDTDVTFTIENTGTADLILSGSPIITITGADADQFSVQQQPTSPISDGGGSTTFIIRFSPSSEGFKEASISIANNDTDENPYDITLEGTGVVLTGSLTVTIEPQGAIDAGAQWKRLCTATWHGSGYTESDIIEGEVIVEFKDIAGWLKPDDKIVSIPGGDTAVVTGIYTQLLAAGTFVDSGQSLGSSDSRGVALGDVDADGDLDVFVTNGASQANRVWLNDGSGTFTDSGQNLGSSTSQSVALGDLDGDGDLDAFVTNSWSQANRVWLNDGSGTFTDSGQSLSGGSYSYGVALGDLDCDGDLDAFVANAGGANKVWLNDGSGTFTDSGQSIGDSDSYGIALVDLDGDGDLDAFVTNHDEPHYVWLNDGSGTFTDSGQSLGGGSNNRGLALGDVDGDGDLDAFAANQFSQANKVWLNDGSGMFTDSGQSLGHSNSIGVALGDVDGDGDLDAFVANWSGSDANKVWLNDGSGTFTDSGQSLGDVFSAYVVLGDVDGDGDLDAFVANGYETPGNKVWLNTCITPEITEHPQSQTIDYNTTAALSVSATSAQALSYQWYQGDSGDTSTPVGEDSDSYTTANLTETTSYWVRVSNVCGSIDSDTAIICVLPATPINLSPSDGSVDAPIDTDLDWEDSSGAASYDVYFGTTSPPPYLTETGDSYLDTGSLNAGITYYWKIVAKNDYGETHGEEWSFTTGGLQQYSLTINAAEGGTTDPAPDTYTYDSGTEVTITAQPESGYRFNGWSGDVPSGHENDNPLTFTMDSNKSATAKFIRQYSLTIDSGEGGTTNPEPGSYTYDEGEEVSIEATPGEDYRFSGWNGDIPSGHENDNPLIVIMNADKTITANFTPQYTLTIIAEEGGTTDPAPDTYTYDSGTEVTITAQPESGYRFNGWNGDVPSGHETDNPLTLTMDSDKSVTANFMRQYTLTVIAGEGGSTDPAPDTYTYDSGTEVTITAQPESGYRFNGWSGDVPSGHETDNPLTFTMDSNKSITANFFLIPQYTLTIAAGTGGTTDPPPGDHMYNSGTTITIIATADTGYRFSGWTGDVPAGHETDNPLTITMDSNKSVRINFIRQYTLTIVAGAGGTTDPAPDTYTYDSGTEVTITAKPESGYRFNGWNGDIPSGHENDNPLIVTMNADKTVTANFTPQYTLTITAGTGGTTDSAPGTYTYDSGTEVTITAQPESGYGFNGWSGDVPSGHENDNPLTFTMDSDKSITANFLISQYTLIIIAGEGGTTNPASGSHTYITGTTVTVTAIADNGYRFENWSGDVSSTDNPVEIIMDSDKTITANFIRQYTLTIAADSGGTTNPSPGSYAHDAGASVSVTALPNSGYNFSGWSGDASGTTETITITMDSDKSITASFIKKPPNGDDQGGGCFIATAAYGSPLHPHIDILRQFRDKYLMTNKLGRKFVAMYYKYSPSVAERIAKCKILKVFIRIQLLPLVALGYSMVYFGPINTAFVSVLMLPIFLIQYSRRKFRRKETKAAKA